MEGRKVPDVTFKMRVRDESIGGDNPFKWEDVASDEIFKDKKIIVFSLPGAFTPTCSSTHLPGFERLYDEIKAEGVDEIYCMSVNDAFVMNKWGNDQEIKNVKLLPDGNGEFTRKMGMLVKKNNLGFGDRSWRYSMLVDNKKVVKQFIEEGKNDSGDDQDPFKVSDADTMLKYLQEAK